MLRSCAGDSQRKVFTRKQFESATPLRIRPLNASLLDFRSRGNPVPPPQREDQPTACH